MPDKKRMLQMDIKGSITVKAKKKVDPMEVIDGILEGREIKELRSKAASKMLKRKLGK